MKGYNSKFSIGASKIIHSECRRCTAFATANLERGTLDGRGTPDRSGTLDRLRWNHLGGPGLTAEPDAGGTFCLDLLLLISYFLYQYRQSGTRCLWSRPMPYLLPTQPLYTYQHMLAVAAYNLCRAAAGRACLAAQMEGCLQALCWSRPLLCDITRW